MYSDHHRLLISREGLNVLNPVSNRKTKKSKSYLIPKPEPIAISERSSKPLNLISSLSTSSQRFQMFPKSTNSPPFKDPVIAKRYSRLKANLKLASLKSFILLLLPGPNLYAFHALLSFAPPEKYDLEKGILLEF